MMATVRPNYFNDEDLDPSSIEKDINVQNKFSMIEANYNDARTHETSIRDAWILVIVFECFIIGLYFINPIFTIIYIPGYIFMIGFMFS